jgi:hypothetical protein
LTPLAGGSPGCCPEIMYLSYNSFFLAAMIGSFPGLHYFYKFYS